MSDIAGELARVREAFDKPTLRLLDRKWSPFVLAVFRSSFSRDRQTVPADRLHSQVDAYLDELRGAGEEVPGASGRTQCLQWMRDQWLYRSADDAGEEHYSLTSHALEAMGLVESLSRERALISESRLTMILDAVRQWATEASPDREERVARLDTEIARLTAERDRIASGGEVLAASDDRMLEGYQNLSNLIGQLPSDFKRVEESVAGMHRKILTDFREEERPIGEVLDEYLDKSDQLMSATHEGRAFEGALHLLRNDALLLDLKTDLQRILHHPFAGMALRPEDRREFLGTVSVIRQGIEEVLGQRSRLSTTLREHIESHDVAKDREFDALLRQINRELATWMQTAGPRSGVPVALLPATVEMDHLQERLHDPGSDVPPPPLEDVSAYAPEPSTLTEIRQQGGPLLAETRAAIMAAYAAGDVDSVGEAFNTLPADLRRLVEVLGLMHMATQIGALNDGAGVEQFDTIRPDGTHRVFEVPRLALGEEKLAALAALDEEGTGR